MADKYLDEVMTIKCSNGCTVRIRRPDISEEERERRLEEFKKGVAVFMKHVYAQQAAQNK